MPPVGRGTAIDPLIDRKTNSTAHLLAALAHLSAPDARVLDASNIISGSRGHQWRNPLADGSTVTLWLAA